MRPSCISLFVAAALGACSEAPVGPAGPTGRLDIAVAPLDLAGVTDACYELTVSAGGVTVFHRDGLCADRFGDGAGSISYVGACDADPDGRLNTIALVMRSLEADDRALTEGTDFVNPCPAARPCELERPCRADEDTSVTFDLTVMRRAEQGFFDVAVEFADLFCSAKLDCAYAEGGRPIELLYAADGQRHDTAVLAFACTDGPGAYGDTALYLDDVVLSCVDGAGAEVFRDVMSPSAGRGNRRVPGPIGADEPPVFQYAVSAGTEDLPAVDKAWWSVQVGVNVAALEASSALRCDLTTRGTAAPRPLVGATTPDAIYPVLSWSVPVWQRSGPDGRLSCGQQPLDGGGGVTTGYAPAQCFGNELVADYAAGTVDLHPTGACGPRPCTGEPPANLCRGVCTFVPPVCRDGVWGCDGPGYEPVEETCDGFDNDCDGAIDEDVCDACVVPIADVSANLHSKWDIDFDYACRTYLTSFVSGGDYSVELAPATPPRTYFGNANQDMGFALVDPDASARRVVVLYSCVFGCFATNGLTLLYTCSPSDPGCGCTGQSHCPGFLDAPFIATRTDMTGVSYAGYALGTPTGLAAGAGPSYFVGNFATATCDASATCLACDPAHPDVFCSPTTSGCCQPSALGRLGQFTLPAPGVEPTWRTAAVFDGEVIMGLASARDGTVAVGTRTAPGAGNLYRFVPASGARTLLHTFTGMAWSVTQDRQTGDFYVETKNPTAIVRLAEDGTVLALPPSIPATPAGEAVLEVGPDRKLYRLVGATDGTSSLAVYPLP